MLTSLALLFLCGLALGEVFRRLKLPRLLGMLLAGMALGPYGLNLLDAQLLAIAPDLRQIALILILLRAGLALDISDLKRAGRPALLLCFMPALCEIGAVVLLAPLLLGVSHTHALLLGTVLAAVSPAVVVPGMLRLMEEGRGTAKAIPQMILAGASVDDVFVIVLFTAAMGLAGGAGFHAAQLLRIPLAILLGVAGGLAAGGLFALFFRRFHLRDSAKVLLLLSLSFLLVALGEAEASLPFSGLLAVMTMGIVLAARRPAQATRLAAKCGRLWVGAEVVLFVLVGASVNLPYALKAGPTVVLVLLGALVVRMAGVALCTVGTGLTKKERLFCALAYIPKATVQAAIGAIPLAAGIESGELVLTAAVLAILITAPLGAVAIERTAPKLLTKP